MPHRITVPDGYVAFVLSTQRANELIDMLKLLRIEPRSVAHVDNRAACHKIVDEVMPVLLETRKAQLLKPHDKLPRKDN